MIPEITDSQKLELPRYYEKWRDVAVSTKPVDRAEVERIAPDLYRAYGLSPPSRIAWLDSPFAICAENFVYANLDRTISYFPYSTNILDGLFAELNKSDYMPNRLSLDYNPLRHVERQDRNLFQLWEIGRVGGQEMNAIRKDYCDYPRLYCVDFLRNVCGLLKLTERAAPLLEMGCRACFLPRGDTLYVSENPSRFTIDAANRPHGDSGPAIVYQDDFKIYAWHGVIIPERFIEDKITVEEIESQRNLELRRIMTEIYGLDRYVRDSGPTLIAKDALGELYLKDVPGAPILMVKVINSTIELDGSNKEYWLRVDPELRPLLGAGIFGRPQELTPRNAIASTFGLYGYQYNPKRQT